MHTEQECRCVDRVLQITPLQTGFVTFANYINGALDFNSSKKTLIRKLVALLFLLYMSIIILFENISNPLDMKFNERFPESIAMTKSHCV